MNKVAPYLSTTTPPASWVALGSVVGKPGFEEQCLTISGILFLICVTKKSCTFETKYCACDRPAFSWSNWEEQINWISYFKVRTYGDWRSKLDIFQKEEPCLGIPNALKCISPEVGVEEWRIIADSECGLRDLTWSRRNILWEGETVDLLAIIGTNDGLEGRQKASRYSHEKFMKLLEQFRGCRHKPRKASKKLCSQITRETNAILFCSIQTFALYWCIAQWQCYGNFR